MKTNSLHLKLLVAVVLLSRGHCEAGNWPAYRGDNQRSGAGTESFSFPLNEGWVYQCRYAPRPAWPDPAKRDVTNQHEDLRPCVVFDRSFQLVADEDSVYFGSSADDQVRALDAATGELKWSFFTGGPVRFAPALYNGNLYVGSDDGTVYCLRASDGQLLWKQAGSESSEFLPGNERMISRWPVRTGVVVDQGTAYFAAGLFPGEGVFLNALDAASGSVQWRQPIRISAQGYILASSDRLVIPTGRTSPSVFSRSDGSLLGRLPTGTGGAYALIVDDDVINGPGRRTKGLEASDIQDRDSIAVFDGLRMAVDGTMAYVQTETTLGAVQRGVYQDLENEYVWTVPNSNNLALVASGGTLFVGGENKVAAIDAGDGSTLWEATVNGKAYGLAVANGRLLVSTDQGAIYSFSADGTGGVQGPPALVPVDSGIASNVVDRIVQETGVDKGYGLVLGCPQGTLAYELAQRTELQIVVVEPDAERVAAARAMLDAAGCYGTRITIHQGSLETLPYPPYFANLIVSEDALLEGTLPPSSNAVARLLRPAGGHVVLTMQSGSTNETALANWGEGVLPHWSVEEADGLLWGTALRDPLPGAGEWTHTYAEPGNSACSGDQLTSGKMAVQWFGRPGPNHMLDRHFRNIPPLYKDGRLFAPGNGVVYALDAYNGTALWQTELPLRAGVFLGSTSMIVDDQYLYVVDGAQCRRYGAGTGDAGPVSSCPQPFEPDSTLEWGWIARSGDMLLGSGRPEGTVYNTVTRNAELYTEPVWYPNMRVATSRCLFGTRPGGGTNVWTYQSSGRIIDTTIAAGNGRVFFVESTSPAASTNTTGRLTMRELTDGDNCHLVALDIETGEEAFNQALDTANFKQPSYLSYADGKLVLSGSRIENGEDITASGYPAVGQISGDEVIHYYLQALDAGNGTELWHVDIPTTLAIRGGHGEYNRHPTIIGDRVFAYPHEYDLNTGARLDWNFVRGGAGCGNISASETALFWRGGNPVMYDLEANRSTHLNRVSRPGCFINIIPAGGLVLVPEASSGCTCGYPIQTSMAFAPAMATGNPPPQPCEYSDAVESLAPSVYYRLDEAAGQLDGEAVTNVGTLGVAYSGTWGSGLSGYPDREAISGQPGPSPTDVVGGRHLGGLNAGNLAAQFSPDSNSDMISINVGSEGGAPTALDTASQTYAFFFKTSQTDGWTRLVTTDPDEDNRFDIVFENATRQLVLINGNADSAAYESANSYSDGKWHHLVAIRDSGARGDMRLYIDGKAVPLIDRGGGWTAGYQARFGALGTSGSSAYEGYLDEIAIWNRALTEEEALGLFDAAAPPPCPYTEEVLSLNPKVYYPLNDEAGQLDGSATINLGSAGAAYNGTWGSGLSGYPEREAISGQPGPSSAVAIGERRLDGLDTNNLAARFSPDSYSDMISINVGGEGGAPTAFDTAAQTISLFFKTTQNNGYGRIYTSDPDCAHTFTLEMGYNSSGYEGRLYLAVGTSSSSARYSDHSFNDGKWHHLVAVRGGNSRSDLKLYVDGKEETLHNSSVSLGAGYQARFGARGTGSGGFDGSMDEIAIWDRTLTGEEALGLFNAAAPLLAPLGTPQEWLTSHGLTNMPTLAEEELADIDSDGVPAWQEWVCDTDPTSSGSVLECTAINPGESGMQLYWRGGVLATQVLERCTNLSSGVWMPFFTNTPPTAETNGFHDLSATNREGFYRIKVWR